MRVPGSIVPQRRRRRHPHAILPRGLPPRADDPSAAAPNPACASHCAGRAPIPRSRSSGGASWRRTSTHRAAGRRIPKLWHARGCQSRHRRVTRSSWAAIARRAADRSSPRCRGRGSSSRGFLRPARLARGAPLTALSALAAAAGSIATPSPASHLNAPRGGGSLAEADQVAARCQEARSRRGGRSGSRARASRWKTRPSQSCVTLKRRSPIRDSPAAHRGRRVMRGSSAAAFAAAQRRSKDRHETRPAQAPRLTLPHAATRRRRPAAPATTPSRRNTPSSVWLEGARIRRRGGDRRGHHCCSIRATRWWTARPIICGVRGLGKDGQARGGTAAPSSTTPRVWVSSGWSSARCSSTDRARMQSQEAVDARGRSREAAPEWPRPSPARHQSPDGSVGAGDGKRAATLTMPHLGWATTLMEHQMSTRRAKQQGRRYHGPHWFFRGGHGQRQRVHRRLAGRTARSTASRRLGAPEPRS